MRVIKRDTELRWETIELEDELNLLGRRANPHFLVAELPRLRARRDELRRERGLRLEPDADAPWWAGTVVGTLPFLVLGWLVFLAVAL
jgi:hypothetical protein